jgi:hypothetical protein
MQRCVAVLLSCALALGCSRGAAKGGVIAGVGITTIGIAMAAGAFGPGGDTDPEDVAFIPLTVGILLGTISLFIMLGTKDPEDNPAVATAPPPAPPPAPDPKIEQARRDRARAWELTQQAAAAARVNDCVRTAQLGAEVASLDADFHATVFSRDAAIARCFQQDAPPTAPTAAP